MIAKRVTEVGTHIFSWSKSGGYSKKILPYFSAIFITILNVNLLYYINAVFIPGTRGLNFEEAWIILIVHENLKIPAVIISSVGYIDPVKTELKYCNDMKSRFTKKVVINIR